jgi:hypothetical protein
MMPPSTGSKPLPLRLPAAVASERMHGVQGRQHGSLPLGSQEDIERRRLDRTEAPAHYGSPNSTAAEAIRRCVR